MYKILVENSRDYSNNKVVKGVLEFTEEEIGGKIQELTLLFDDKNIRDELDRVKELAVATYKKIVSLDFPNTDKYEKSLEGIKAFEDDLIAGRV
jgi:hypothetical protein